MENEFVRYSLHAIGCQGGFIASGQKWKQLIKSRGHSFIFSTALSIPVIASTHTAVLVARKEKWMQEAVLQRVKEFLLQTGLEFLIPIILLVIGEKALQVSKHLLESGFHVSVIRPLLFLPNHADYE